MSLRVALDFRVSDAGSDREVLPGEFDSTDVGDLTEIDDSPDLTPGKPLEVSARSRFLVYQNRGETENYTLIGKRTDRLRKDSGQWKISRREIILDQDILLAKVLTMFFKA